MKLRFDAETAILVGGVVVVLIVASIIGWILSRRLHDLKSQSTIVNLNARIRAWMIAIFLLAMLSGGLGSVVLSLG